MLNDSKDGCAFIVYLDNDSDICMNIVNEVWADLND